MHFTAQGVIPLLPMHILLIKTSSLGDVVHNLPVVTDLRRRYPDATIDWVVEERFCDIPRLHPGLRRIIPVAVRRWRRAPLSPATWKEVFAFRQSLQAEAYDLAIDTQGLLKSALLTRLSRARRCGYDAASAREPIAARFYDAGFSVPKTLHAVARNRQLAALAAGYAVPSVLDYGIAVLRPQSEIPDMQSTPALAFGTPCAVLLTATSRDDKLWPDERWIALGQALSKQGLACLLPAGSPAERVRAERLAREIPGARVSPPSSLREIAEQMAAARIVIGVDTGLVHLAAALGRPTLALFRASEPALTGVLATTPFANLGARRKPPTVAEVLAAANAML